MKMFINKTDLFPFFEMHKEDPMQDSVEIEVSETLYEDYLAAMIEFDAIQDELQEIYEGK